MGVQDQWAIRLLLVNMSCEVQMQASQEMVVVAVTKVAYN